MFFLQINIINPNIESAYRFCCHFSKFELIPNQLNISKNAPSFLVHLILHQLNESILLCWRKHRPYWIDGIFKIFRIQSMTTFKYAPRNTNEKYIHLTHFAYLCSTHPHHTLYYRWQMRWAELLKMRIFTQQGKQNPVHIFYLLF
jgi:hypothetical protein